MRYTQSKLSVHHNTPESGLTTFFAGRWRKILARTTNDSRRKILPALQRPIFLEINERNLKIAGGQPPNFHGVYTFK